MQNCLVIIINKYQKYFILFSFLSLFFIIFKYHDGIFVVILLWVIINLYELSVINTGYVQSQINTNCD